MTKAAARGRVAVREDDMVAGEMMMGGRAYVVIPREQYYLLRGQVPPGSVEAGEAVRASIAAALVAARKAAGISCAALAARLKVGVSAVTAAESGRVDVTEAYMRRVLKACGLPKDWTPPQG